MKKSLVVCYFYSSSSQIKVSFKNITGLGVLNKESLIWFDLFVN